MSMTNRAYIGARDIVYAVLTDGTDVSGGTPTWGTIYSLPESVEINFDQAASQVTKYADDGPAHVGTTTGDMKITLDLAGATPDHQARILGYTYSSGQLVGNTADVPVWIALGFKTLMDGTYSGSPVYEYTWIYKCQFGKPSYDHKTKGATIEFQDTKLMGRPVKLLSTGNYFISVRTDDTNVASSFLSGFFSSVALPATDLTALSAVIAKSSGNITVTFSKGSGSSFSMNAATINAATVVITDATSERAGTWVVGSAGTTVVATFTPTVAFSAETIGVAVLTTVADTAGVHPALTTKTLAWS